MMPAPGKMVSLRLVWLLIECVKSKREGRGGEADVIYLAFILLFLQFSHLKKFINDICRVKIVFV